MNKKFLATSLVSALVIGAGITTYYLIPSTPEPTPELTDETTANLDCDINDDGIIEDKEIELCTQDVLEVHNAIDIRLPSDSTGSEDGTLAVRIYLPDNEPRYEAGAPVIVWAEGGYEMKGIDSDLMNYNDDFIIVTLLYPGVDDSYSMLSSDGEYDDRGENCIAAMRDAVLFAAGELTDDEGRTIEEVIGMPVLYDNIGMIGVSNGGNIIVAVAALYGELLVDHLKYIIQWETPVSSQIANRDFGRVVYDFGSGRQGDYFNERFIEYGSKIIKADWSDLAYDPDEDYYIVFHDGDGDRNYTTVEENLAGKVVDIPDVNLDNELTAQEDWPLDSYPEGDKKMYSRAVTYALEEYNVFDDDWPENIGTPEEADAYWDIREAVWMYEDVMEKLPDLYAMILGNVEDHVQSSPQKLHLHQAFEGWNENGAWVQINPSPTYVISADETLEGRMDLPNNEPNVGPGDWYDIDAYCMPSDVEKQIYQLASVWEMMDKVQRGE